MVNLSIGAVMAWQIAALETAIAKQEYIEKEQLLIGILSLGKALMSRTMTAMLDPSNKEELKRESETIEKVLKKYNLDSTRFRRHIRKEVGLGDFERMEKVVHRSEDCKKLFFRAEELANNSDNINSLYLIAAILEENNDLIQPIFNEFSIIKSDLKNKALFYAGIVQKQKQPGSSMYI